jgi:hypothetical protein
MSFCTANSQSRPFKLAHRTTLSIAVSDNLDVISIASLCLPSAFTESHMPFVVGQIRLAPIYELDSKHSTTSILFWRTTSNPAHQE